MAVYYDPGDVTYIRALGSGVHEASLSRRNREYLFNEIIESMNQASGEAKLTLSTLKRLSPALASSFGIRTPGEILATPFRVMVVSDEGTVEITDDRPLEQYLAVSYCWRHSDSDWPGDGSSIHAPWPFSKIFVDAVLAERGVDSENTSARHTDFNREGIWVDQLCINQSDREEKARSIAFMDVIYKRCRKLLILLEDVFLTEEEVRALNAYGFEEVLEGLDGTIEEQHIEPLTSVWRKIERSRWWSRSWCWHEFEINEPWSTKRLQFYQNCAIFVAKAPHGQTFKIKWLLLLFIRVLTDGLSSSPDTHRTIDANQIKNNSRWAISDNNISRHDDPAHRERGTKRSSVMSRFYVASSSECSVLSDLVSITINLSGLGLFFRGAVADRDELFWVVATLALAAGGKAPLTLMRDHMLKIGGQESWLSSHPAGYDTTLATFMLGGNQNIHAVSAQSIELDLLFFNHSAEFVTKDELAATYKIFKDFPIRSREVLYRRQSQGALNYQNDDKFDKSRRLFLAAACKGGLRFVERLWKQLSRDVVPLWTSQQIFEPFKTAETLRPAAERLKVQLNPGSQTSGGDDPIEFLHSFLTWITDPRALVYISAMCLHIPSGDGEHALVCGPTLRKMGTLDITKWRLAMPVDLAGIPCTVLRAWILQPADESKSVQDERGRWESTDERWMIIGKMLLFGEPDLLESQGTAMRVRQVVSAN